VALVIGGLAEFGEIGYFQEELVDNYFKII
jgi:hypothetical protein